MSSNSVSTANTHDVLHIWGGNTLSGEVTVSGAKNSALILMAASILCSSTCRLTNVPALADVKTMGSVLKALGLKLKHEGESLEIDASHITTSEAPSEYVTKMRASFFIVGALLTRLGTATVPLPGGCSIGDRPVDLHVRGLQALGADVRIEDGVLYADVKDGKKRLPGGHFRMDFPSVGATENIIMAATLAEGETVLENAAREPEIVDLANFCNAMGAKISGAGTSRIVIQGVERLHDAEHRVVPDRIEASTFLLAGAMTRSPIVVGPMVPGDITAVLLKMKESGISVVVDRPGFLRVVPTDIYRGVDIETLPHPDFPTDVQSPFMALMTLAQGESKIKENLFENRLQHVAELQRMGADISLKGNVATVRGVAKLVGASVMATDLRASAALVIAGLSAEGKTVLRGLHHLDRGYADLTGKMKGLGARIERTQDSAETMAMPTPVGAA
jgi:UDP-N-acetylglucosamine 1-carboxyvinyltransferase